MRTCLLSVLMVLLCFSHLFAEEEEKDSKKEQTPSLFYQLVITATRSPQSTKELGSSLSILPGGQFGGAVAPDVVSRLASLPGLSFTQNGGFGQSAAVSIRGANSEHTLVLIDGVEVNDPSSPSRSFDFGTLDMNAVERIEVLRGAQSPLYGSDAIGGVIHVITRDARDKGLSFSLGAEAGRYETFRERLNLSGRFGQASFNLGLSRTDSKGFSSASARYGNSEADGLAQNQFNFKANLAVSPVLNVGLNARYTQALIDLDNGAGIGGDDPNYQADNRHLLLALKGEWTLFEGWKQTLMLSYQRINRDYDNPADALNPFDSSLGEYLAGSRKINWQHEIRFSDHYDLVAGLEWQEEKAESSYIYTSTWGDSSSIFPKATADTLSAYASLNLDLGERLFINSGLRYDRHGQFGSQLSIKFSPAFFITPSTKLMGSISNGFKAPSLYQLFAPATMWGPVGNLDLRPETALTMDFGIQQSIWDYRIVLDVSAFFNRYRNLIDYDWISGYINIAEALSRGVEISLLLQPSHRIQISGSYTYTDAVDELSQLPLLRRPKHRYGLSSTWRISGTMAFSADLRHVGSRPDIYPYPERVSNKAHTLLSAGLEWKALQRLKLFLRLENIADVQYEPVMGYGAAGRSAFLGVQWDI